VLELVGRESLIGDLGGPRRQPENSRGDFVNGAVHATIVHFTPPGGVRTPVGKPASWLTIKMSAVAAAPDALPPGNLAAWDGHVAMVVGYGLSNYWTVSDPCMSEWYLQ
jgi:hypothetical protein